MTPPKTSHDDRWPVAVAQPAEQIDFRKVTDEPNAPARVGSAISEAEDEKVKSTVSEAVWTKAPVTSGLSTL